MNGILLYRSRYGATKQYADWIGSDLRLPVIDPERMDQGLLATCDFLLIGTSVYYGELLLKAWLKEYVRDLQHKKLFFFIVCAPSPDVSKHGQIIMDNIPSALLRPSTDIFFLPGRWVPEGQAVSPDNDAVKKENTTELVEAVRSFAGTIPI
ncbi:MAG TPA: flavodoxin domain-containing protein [Puia sp.]|nr:flavodoxin domain-containing protein [Puia sp.]